MLDIRGLNKNYKNGFSLNDISLHLNPGDFVMLFGSKGSGKTALLYNILGMHHFREGEILFQGRSLLRLTEAERREMRFVPDTVCMEPITAKDYFGSFARKFSTYDPEDAVDLCGYFGLDMDKKLTDMTYNENKLTTIVAAIVTNPKLLILDEPMNYLNDESKVKLLIFLQFLASKEMTVLLTCETALEAEEYCSNYLYLQNGQITHQGLVADVYGSKKAITIKGGKANSKQNLFGEPIAKRGESATYLFCSEGQKYSLRQIISMIGPEDIQIENLSIEEILNEDYTRWM